MAEELTQCPSLGCHGGKEGCWIGSSGPFHSAEHGLKTRTMQVERRSVVDDRQEETCLPGHSTSETDSQGDGKELRCSAWGPQGPSVPSECS